MSSVISTILGVFSYVLIGYILKKIHLVPVKAEQIFTNISFNYDFTSIDFQSSEMNLVGDAFWTSDYDELFTPYPNRLRLTYNSDGLMGSAWLNEPFDASQSWSTIFRFQISKYLT